MTCFKRGSFAKTLPHKTWGPHPKREAFRSIVLAAVASLAVTACYDTPRPACAFLCGTDSSCPDGYFCATDGWCKSNGTADGLVCEPGAVDAAVQDTPTVDTPDLDAGEIDASEPDAAIDAAIDAGIDAPTDAAVDAAVAALTIITASPLAFGDVPQTGTAMLPVMVRNGGGATSTALAVTVTGTGFSRIAAGDTCDGMTLASMATCSFHVQFAPGALGAATGVASATAASGGMVSINLTGTGVAALSPSVSPVAFGNVTVSTTAMTTVTLTNQGAATTGTLAVARTGDAAFSVLTDTCAGMTVGAGLTCAITVRFAPTATGAVTGQLAVTGNPGGPLMIGLTGTGE